VVKALQQAVEVLSFDLLTLVLKEYPGH